MDAKRNWPSIEYNGWQKIYEEKIFTEDQKMWAFAITNQQNDNTSSQPLQPKKRHTRWLIIQLPEVLMNHIYIYIYAVEHLQSIRRWWIRSSIGSLPEDGQGQYKHKEVQQRDWVRPQRRDQRPTKNPKVVSSYRYWSTNFFLHSQITIGDQVHNKSYPQTWTDYKSKIQIWISKTFETKSGVLV